LDFEINLLDRVWIWKT